MLRFILIATSDYPIADHHLVRFGRGGMALREYFEEQVGPLAASVESHIKQTDVTAEEAWRDPFRFSHEAARSIGVDPWEHDVATLYVWRGGGGYAGGMSFDFDPSDEDPHSLGWAMVGDWGLGDDAYDVENRPGWVATQEPNVYGAWAHELAHALNVGPHTNIADNLMSLGYLQFPACTLTAEQVERVRATGFFQTPEPPPKPDPDVRMAQIAALMRVTYKEQGWPWPDAVGGD